MARKVKDKELDSKAARATLKPSGTPYWRAIERGVHLGYRRLKGKAGTWCVRRYVGEQSYKREGIGIADDVNDADGIEVLTFWQAAERARGLRVERVIETADTGKPLTVAAAWDEYIAFLKTDGRTVSAIKDAEGQYNAFIGRKLGEVEVAELTNKKLKAWRDGLASAAPRLRTKPGEKQQFREFDQDDDEAKRKRRSAANRIWTTLRACLNLAFQNHEGLSDAAWRKVKPFHGVDAAKMRYLSIAEVKRLVNACESDFRKLVQGAIYTGARYGSLARLTAGDFDPDARTVRFSTRKGKGQVKVFHSDLNAEGYAFFKSVCVGKAPSALIFPKASGAAWGKSHQQRPIMEASERARIDPPANFHVTRHTYCSHAIMAGADKMAVAKSIGHSDTRMIEKVYGHLSPGYVAKQIRAHAPRFGFKPDRKIAAFPR
jgi:integrase